MGVRIAISVSGMFVCLCLYVCTLGYPLNHVKISRNFLRPWLGPPLMTVQYVVYSGFVDDVMFSHNATIERMGQNQARRYAPSNSPDGGTGSEVAVYTMVNFLI